VCVPAALVAALPPNLADAAQDERQARVGVLAARNVGIIKTAAETTWTAAAWWLERRRPADFGKRERHEHTGPGGAEIVVKVIGRGTSVDEL